jgi:hypothetical protein
MWMVLAVIVSSNTEALCTECGKIVYCRIVMPSSRRGCEEREIQCQACGHTETVFIQLE